jgi:selenophosphate synthase
MNTTFAAALLVTTMGLGAAPSIASAAPVAADNNIALLGTAASIVPIVGDEFDRSNIAGPTRFKVSFVNRGDEPATAVEFQVDSSDASSTIDDVGTFTKGAVVTHSFYKLLAPDATVSVIGVKYADGSEWSANAESPFVTRRQASAIGPSLPDYTTSYN